MAEPKPFSTSGIQAVAKYNPHLWGPEDLKAIFVARQRELAELTQAIRDAEPTSCPQHILLIGQRGMGKTTLLQRIALQVEEDKDLSKDWLALRFPEEQYTVSNLAELWGNVLGALADALEAKGESTQLIDQNLLMLESLPVEEREDKTLELINQWCEQHQQRLLLLIDSTDLLFDNLNDAKKSKKDDIAVSLWRLRNTLQSNRNLFWLGGSYQALEGSDLYHDTFQDFFHMVELKPLTLEEVQNAMRAMAHTFGTGGGVIGEAAENVINKALSERPERLKTLRQLTGGNPRTTVMLFELFAAGGNNQVRSDLERLLDMMTPLYKARLEALADQQRKLIAHIMEAWQPISLGDLAKVSGMVNTKVSPLLARMEKDGLIVKAELPNTTRSGYQAAERFFNIWYLMRNAPRRLKLRLAWLVEFMRMWFKPDELEHIAHQRMSRHASGGSELDDLEYSRAVASAMPSGSQTRLSLDYQLFKELQQLKQKLSEYFDFDGEDKPFKSAEEYCQRFEVLKQKLMALSFAESDEEKVEFCELMLTCHGLSMDKKEEMVKGLTEEKYSEVLAFLLKDDIRSKGLWGDEAVVHCKRLILSQDFYLDFPDKDIGFIQINKHFVEYSSFYWHVTKRYWDKFNDDSVDELIIEGFNVGVVCAVDQDFNNIGSLITARYLRPEVAAAFEQVLSLAFERRDVSVLNSLAVMLSNNLNRSDEAEKVFRQAIELGSNVDYVWLNLGNLLKRLNRFEEAEQAYREAISLSPYYSYAWNNLGNLLQGKLNRFKEAEQAYRKAIELDETEPLTHCNLARLYVSQQKSDEATSIYRKALEYSYLESHILLQSHLWLNNTDFANQALTQLAEKASQEDNETFYRIKEQSWESQQMGRGLALADLMANNPYAEFLRPLELALRKVNGDNEAIKGAPLEVQQLALEVVAEIEQRA